jgi:hypothetical protein
MYVSQERFDLQRKAGNLLEKPNKASLGGSWPTCRVHEVQLELCIENEKNKQG